MFQFNVIESQNTLLRYDELQIMCEKYEHYNLNRGNFSRGCPENQCGHDPVLFRLLLEWETVIKYETGDKKDFHNGMFNVALSYDNNSPVYINESILNLLKENKFTIVILQNFPENWEDIYVTMGLPVNANMLLDRIKSNVKSYYEYK